MSKLFEAYPEGADLFLVCEVHGGECQPSGVFMRLSIIDLECLAERRLAIP